MGAKMVDRLTVERLVVQRRGGEQERRIPAQPRLSLTWRLDRITGKPVARWVYETTSNAIKNQDLAIAA